MAKRERFTTSINCPECRKTGTATWEENENSVYSAGDLGTTLKGVSEGFRTSGGSGYCVICGEKATGGGNSN